MAPRRNGEKRAPTADPVPFASTRARRESGIRVSWTAVRTVVAVVTLLGVAAAGVVGVAMAFGSKASNDDVHDLDKRVQKIETSVEVIKTEQRMLIRAIRPDLPVGGE